MRTINELFTIIKNDSEIIIIELAELTPLDVAANPFLSSDWAYLTLKRGRNKILTVVKKDGTTFNMSFGENGYTLVSDSLKELQRVVINYLDDKAITSTLTRDLIWYEYINEPKGFPNKWQLIFRDRGVTHSISRDTKEEIDAIIKNNNLLHNKQ